MKKTLKIGIAPREAHAQARGDVRQSGIAARADVKSEELQTGPVSAILQ